jgi:hypothetical protein
MKSMVRWIPVVVTVCMVLPAPGTAQLAWERGEEGWCDRDWGRRDGDRFCEVLTASMASPGALRIDGGTNGSVDIVAGTGNQVHIRAKVFADARSTDRAQEIARQVDVRVDGDRIYADGPDTGRRESWGVSYEITVPADTDLDIETFNGGIAVEDVAGEITFEAVNGGVHLTGVAGDVHGRTTNGGLHIELDGDRWQGAGLDAETTNGGIELYVPEGYSAELETGTVNGGIDIDFPVTVQGRIGRRLRTTLGSGGPRVRVVTTNGGVTITSR